MSGQAEHRYQGGSVFNSETGDPARKSYLAACSCGWVAPKYAPSEAKAEQAHDEHVLIVIPTEES